jgi:hypothetical protein
VASLLFGRSYSNRASFAESVEAKDGAVRSDCVVVVPPGLDRDLGFAQTV